MPDCISKTKIPFPTRNKEENQNQHHEHFFHTFYPPSSLSNQIEAQQLLFFTSNYRTGRNLIHLERKKVTWRYTHIYTNAWTFMSNSTFHPIWGIRPTTETLGSAICWSILNIITSFSRLKRYIYTLNSFGCYSKLFNKYLKYVVINSRFLLFYFHLVLFCKTARNETVKAAIAHSFTSRLVSGCFIKKKALYILICAHTGKEHEQFQTEGFQKQINQDAQKTFQIKVRSRFFTEQLRT